MKVLLTSRGIESFTPEANQYTAWDTSLKSFGVRVSPKGTKTFIVMRGKERKVTTLGRFPELSLKDARTRAMREMTSETVSLRDAEPQKVIEAFLDSTRGRVKAETLRMYRYNLERLELTTIHLTYPDVLEKLKRWNGKPWAQNYAYASLRTFLNWCLEHEYIDKSPLFRKSPPQKTRSRERVLSDSELGRIWRCTDDTTYGRILRLLLLTGQRRIEVKNLKPEDVADGLITFHTKGDKLNVLPVTPLVEENLKLPFVFNNWATAKNRFDTDCGVSFRHHDLRRTLATKLASMEVDVVVIERILGHAIPGVAGIYNRHSYLPQIRAALLKYEEHIKKIVYAVSAEGSLV